MEIFVDLGDLSEDARIDILGHRSQDHGETNVFVVEDDEKADRYIAKLTSRYKVKILRRGVGPITNSVFVEVGPTTN